MHQSFVFHPRERVGDGRAYERGYDRLNAPAVPGKYWGCDFFAKIAGSVFSRAVMEGRSSLLFPVSAWDGSGYNDWCITRFRILSCLNHAFVYSFSCKNVRS